MSKRIFIIGKVWPEPGSSAAGSRMVELMKVFLENDWKITFGTATGESEFSVDLEGMGIKTVSIQLNDASFDAQIKKLNPAIVLFDRFTSEEQFGWRVAEHCPNALRILDTEDLHCLRAARKIAVEAKRDFNISDLHNDITKRELASIYRCDLSLIISAYEMHLLKDIMKVPEDLIYYLPFLIDPLSPAEEKNLPRFEERKHLISIGNFLHEPNFDSVKYLKKSIWPLIRKKLPKAEVHVYGAYPSQKVFELDDKKSGFMIKGRASSAEEVMKNARVCLAPLRFGAGLKGKLADAIKYGTPNVTTTIGAEGMYTKETGWAGLITDDPKEYADAAVVLHEDQNLWERSRGNGFVILKTLFAKEQSKTRFMEKILFLQQNTVERRLNNFTGSMLMHHTALSTKYMALWIEAKNKLKI